MLTTPREFRNRTAQFGLERVRCTACGRVSEPTARTCYGCRGDDLEAITLSPRGRIVTFVVQHVLPAGFPTPLPIAIAETPEGGKVLGVLTDVEDPDVLEIGAPVTVHVRRAGEEDGHPVYELRLRLADPAGAVT